MRRIVYVLVTAACLFAQRPVARADTPADLRALAPAIEKNLTTAILGFWYPKSIDREYGGYTVDFDAAGRFKGQAPEDDRHAGADAVALLAPPPRRAWRRRDARGREAGLPLPDGSHVGRASTAASTGRSIAPARRSPRRTSTCTASRSASMRSSEYARATGDKAALADRATAVQSDRREGARRDLRRLRRVLRRDWSAGAAGRDAVSRRPARREDDEHAPPPDGGADDVLPREPVAAGRDAARRAHHHPEQHRRPQGARRMHGSIRARLDAASGRRPRRARRTDTTSRTSGCSWTRTTRSGSRLRRSTICSRRSSPTRWRTATTRRAAGSTTAARSASDADRRGEDLVGAGRGARQRADDVSS